MPGTTVFLGLGSNLGDREKNLRLALEHLEGEVGELVEISAIYHTAPWGKTDQPAFFNQVVRMQTDLEAPALMRRLLQIEQRMGRKRQERMGPRIIDLDILFYDDAVVDEPSLQIPHPRLEQRNFVLVPLREMAPHWKHPVSGLTMEELLSRSPDKGEVLRLQEQQGEEPG